MQSWFIHSDQSWWHCLLQLWMCVLSILLQPCPVSQPCFIPDVINNGWPWPLNNQSWEVQRSVRIICVSMWLCTLSAWLQMSICVKALVVKELSHSLWLWAKKGTNRFDNMSHIQIHCFIKQVSAAMSPFLNYRFGTAQNTCWCEIQEGKLLFAAKCISRWCTRTCI